MFGKSNGQLIDEQLGVAPSRETKSGETVALQASARVQGDIHHMSLAIEEGAEFDGTCRRPANSKELQPDLDVQSSSS